MVADFENAVYVSKLVGVWQNLLNITQGSRFGDSNGLWPILRNGWVDVDFIVFYVSVLVLFGAFMTFSRGKKPGKQANSPVLFVIYISVAIGFISPLLTLWLGTRGENTLKDAGPVGDWMAGSTVPFFTFAAFLTAYLAYRNQKEELALARELSAQQTRSVELDRFENTLFHLLHEMQEFHDRMVLDYRRDTGDMGHIFGNLLDELKKRAEKALTPKRKEAVADRIERLIQQGTIAEPERGRRYDLELRDIYITLLKGNPLYQHAGLQHLHKYVGNILLLFQRYRLEKEESDFYLNLLNIYLSEEALQLAILYSLIPYDQDPVFMQMRAYGLFERFKTEGMIDPGDYVLFGRLGDSLPKTA